MLTKRLKMLQGFSLNMSIYQITRIIIFFISILSTIYIAYYVRYPGYDYLYILPLTYSMIFVFLISPVLFKRTNIYLMIFAAVSFTRYVIMPFLIVYSGLYGGRSEIPPQSSSLELGINLMAYELVIVAIVVFFLFRKFKRGNIFRNVSVSTPKSHFIYISFLVVTFGLILFNPSVLKSFYFIVPPDDLHGIQDENMLHSIIIYILVVSKTILYIVLMSHLYKKYVATNQKAYVFLSFIITVLNVFIIYGANRADFLITSVVSILLFYKLYPKQSKVASVIIISFLVIILGFINTYRDNITYTEGEDPILDLTNTLQIYLGGPYNVAIAIEAAKLNQEDRDMLHFGYDLLRPTIGPNLLLKNLDYKMSSDHFNQRIYFSDHKSQIIPIIGQGYFYFGFIFSPIVHLLFVIIAKLLLYIQSKQFRIELLFILMIPIARIGLAMGQNGSIMMNNISFFLLLSVSIYYLNNKIVFKKI